jgi:hypothetical protein
MVDGRDWDSDMNVADRPVLGGIRAVSFVVPELAAATRPYVVQLGYQVVAESRLTTERSTAMGAPALAGCAVRTLGPASGEAVFLHFIEVAGAVPPPALTTHGWNATEFVVQDVDALAARLADDPAFTIIGPPASLTRFPMIRAMQVLGPCGECLYFTQVGPGSGLALAEAKCFVGRVFIVVAGGADLKAMFAAYAGFGNATDPPVATPVRVISAANGLPPETLHPHGLVKLAEGTMIELDGYPPITQARQPVAGTLPPGMAMVSVGADRNAILRGGAGELLELVKETA